jgi:membrane-anchored mycosin MYCP
MTRHQNLHLKRNGDERRPRIRVRACAAGAAAMLAVSVCGIAPANAAAAGGASSSGGGGGGRTSFADNTTCTVKAQGITKGADQMAVPWEISYANSQASGMTGKGVTVAVIDSGINASNSQLSKAISGGQDFTGGGNYRQDVDGHGTMVASIIAASRAPSTSGNGMVGVAPGVKLLIYREAGCNVTGGNDEQTLAQAINTAVDQGAQIINISQAGYTANNALKAAVLNAYQKNVLIVAAAGNFGSSDASDSSADYGVNPVTYPAAYAPYLLAVGAATQNGGVADFSETGAYVGVTAPGSAVGGLLLDGKVWYDDGTSFAAPYVAGVAALLLQKNHSWSVGTLIKVLEATAMGNGKWSKSAGWGEVNATAALNADPEHLTGLFGAGPNADGPAAAKPVRHGTSMSPVVDSAPAQTVLDQRKGAYIALGAAALIVAVALAGTFIARDARRRRLPL